MILKKLAEIQQIGVSHNAAIKKRVMLESGDLAGITQYARSVFPPQTMAGEHCHEDMAEIFLVESGQGHIVVEGREHELTPGTCVLVSPGEAHELRNSGEVDMVVTYFGVEMA